MSNVCPKCMTRTGIEDEITPDGEHWIYWCCVCGHDYLIERDGCICVQDHNDLNCPSCY